MADQSSPPAGGMTPDDSPKKGDPFTVDYRSADGRIVTLTAERWMVPPPAILMHEGDPPRPVEFAYEPFKFLP